MSRLCIYKTHLGWSVTCVRKIGKIVIISRVSVRVELIRTVESHLRKTERAGTLERCHVYFKVGEILNLSGLVVIAGSGGGGRKFGYERSGNIRDCYRVAQLSPVYFYGRLCPGTRAAKYSERAGSGHRKQPRRTRRTSHIFVARSVNIFNVYPSAS